MKKIINGKCYDTDKAEAIANNSFADGTNRMNNGRMTTLYKTKKGAFFALHETCWQGEHDTIEPLSEAEAKEVFEELDGDANDYERYFGEAEEA